MTTVSDSGNYRRAMALVTASSLLVPVIGLATAPLLTQALGVAGRGEAGAAVAPNLLLVGVATLGLPQALTFHIARRPHLSRSALLLAALPAIVLGAIGLVVTILATPFLSGGDDELASLMVIATFLAIPALLVNLLRGAASGRQMWREVAAERALNSVLRLVALVVLAVIGELDVLAAVLVMALAPAVAGVVYWRLALASPPPPPDAGPPPRLLREMLDFGGRIWLGSVATMLIARLSQLLVTPLSDVEQLGILIVAITISDIPYIVTQTVRDVVFGVNSAEPETDRLLATSRIATALAFGGSLVLGATLPLWIAALFGDGFDAAIVPTWLLLLSSVIAVPGLIAGAGLDAAGRPGLKSAALVLSLIVYVAGLLLLVPPLGAVGAAVSALVSTVVSTLFGLVAASRILERRMASFVVPHRSDLRMLSDAVAGLRRRFGRGRRGDDLDGS